MVALHDTLKSLALRNANDIDPIAFFEQVCFDHLTYRDISVLLELLQNPAGRSLVLLEMTQFRLRELTIFHLAKRELHRFISVTFFGLHHHDATWSSLNHRDRGETSPIQHLRHAKFFTEQPVRHTTRSLSILGVRA